MTIFNSTKMIAVALIVVASAATANAQNKKYLVNPGQQNQGSQPNAKMYLVNPGGHDHDHHDDIPTLGFYGYQTCQGMVVTKVNRGTEAWKIGLEPGDIIVSIDGFRLHDEGDYTRAMRRAGRHADLRVKDVHGRGIFTVEAHLHGNNNRPVIEYRSTLN
ncbi:PDZ domain-containing protein [uncultured Rubinisphaera sp.]|uniref:PDZ domain-containing protein n=1 Tax=uncultured Rubinisphaera sp. TaxID=1678686 RepID=UPI0030D85DB0